MLKMYLARERSGADAAFWEEGWAHQALGEMVASLERHPLRAPLTRLLPRDGYVLDGGCGIGAWSVYAARHGYRPFGIDFAVGALATLRAAAPDVPVCAGRVDALPLADGAVRAYYSGGVLEHFEEGPAAALAEAYRVLEPGALLLLVVPELSPLRKTLYREHRQVIGDGKGPVVGFEHVAAPRASAAPWPELQFFQYLYGPADLRPWIVAAGLELLWDRGYGVQWALMEVGWVQALSRRVRGSILAAPTDYWDRVPQAPWAQEPLIPEGVPRPLRSALRRLLTLEDDRTPLLGAGLHLLQRLAGNLRLYVCRRPVADGSYSTLRPG